MRVTEPLRRHAASGAVSGPVTHLRDVYDRRRGRLDDADSVRAVAGQSVDLVGAMIAIVVAATVAYVGLQVASQTESAAGFDTSADPRNRTAFENASLSVTEALSVSYSLAEVVFVVIMLSVIVGLLAGLRR